MSSIGIDVNIIQDVLLAIGLFGGVIVFRKNTVPQQTIRNLQELCDSQEKSINELKEGRIENTKHIAKLEGQLELYKELPLKELAEGIKEISKSNKLILSELKKSAIIIAEDKESIAKGASKK